MALAIFMSSPLVALDFLSANGGFVVTREPMQHPELAVVNLIDHVAAAVGRVRFYAGVSIGGVTLVSASVAFSIRFFERRDF